MKYPVVRCEPESLEIKSRDDESVSSQGPRVQMMQGGLELGKPTILFEVGYPYDPAALVYFRVYAEDLRVALNFLEPAPAKRVRKPKEKKATKIAAALSTTVAKPEDYHG